MGKIIPDYFVKKEKEGKGEGRKRRNPSPDKHRGSKTTGIKDYSFESTSC